MTRVRLVERVDTNDQPCLISHFASHRSSPDAQQTHAFFLNTGVHHGSPRISHIDFHQPALRHFHSSTSLPPFSQPQRPPRTHVFAFLLLMYSASSRLTAKLGSDNIGSVARSTRASMGETEAQGRAMAALLSIVAGCMGRREQRHHPA